MTIKRAIMFLVFLGAILAGVLFSARPDSSFPGDYRSIPETEPVAAEVAVEQNERLQARADAFLSLFDGMPPVPMYLTNEPVVKSGTNTERGVAYTTCEKHENPAIYLKKDFYDAANHKQLDNILKHELTHAYLCRQGRMWGHDEHFRRKFEEVGGFGN